MKYEKQVDSSHYSFEKYFYPGRWMSYYYQIKEIATREDVGSVLDIGPGTTFLKDALKIHRKDIVYETLDIAQDVHPTYVGGVTSIPIQDASFDVVSAFQVLEHITFDDFEKALIEMKRVSKKYVFISLPHFGPVVRFLLKIPFVKEIHFAIKVPYLKTHTFNGQHYWEIGKKGYTVKKVRSYIEKHFTILDEYVPFENQYHRFYIMEKK